MIGQTEKYSILESLDEATFRRELIIPILNRVGCLNVRERHGPEEYGKDITFNEVSPLGTTYVAVIAKIGNISGAATGSQNLSTVLNQINMAFEIDLEDVETKQKHKINRVIVWTTGSITNSAQRQIISSLSSQYRNVEFKDKQATLDLTEEFYPGFFTIRDPYISDYFTASTDYYSRIEELRTLGYSSDRQRLPTIFVPPIFVPYGRNKTKRKPATRPQEIKIKNISFSELEESKQNILIIGEAGSGKTTLLRRLLLHTIELNEQRMSKTPIPIFIELRKLDLDDDDCILKAIHDTFIHFSPTGVAPELSSDLADGSFILLLDGLDELKSNEKIKIAICCIENYFTRFPKNRIVVTTRTLELLDDPLILPGFKIFSIKNLNKGQMEAFIEKWFGNNSQLCGKLKKFINNPTALHGLPSTPLVLSLIAILFETGNKEIPANLTELFQKYTELALGRWDVSKDISQQYEWRIKEFILRKISWDLLEKNNSELSFQELMNITVGSSSERGLQIDPQIFISDVISRSELIFSNDEGEYEFKHRSFRDYFCGLEINSLSDSKGLISDHLSDTEWFDAIFFAGGLKPDSDDYLRVALGFSDESIENAMQFAINLGLLAQAKYLCPLATKIEAVKRVLNLLVNDWNCTIKIIQEKKDTDLKDIELNYFSLALIYSLVPAIALGSTTLAQAITEVVNEFIDSQNTIPIDQKLIHEWKLFMLSMACVQSDHVDGVTSIYESGGLSDPLFWVIGSTYIDDMCRHSWLTTEEKLKLEKLSKKLKSKWKRQKEYLTSTIKAPPMLLSTND